MKYRVTDAMNGAKTVAGMPNPGVGKSIDLNDEQAAQPLRLGHIEPLKPVASEPASAKDSAKK